MSFDAIGIISNDLKESTRFYQLLGLDVKEAGGSEHLEATTKSGIRIMIDSVELIKKINPEWQNTNGNCVALCFKQDSPQAVDETYKKIIDAGFKSVKEPWDAFWGQRYSIVNDPDGNPIDIFADK